MEILDYILHIDKYLETILNDYQNWFYLILFLLIFIETGLVVMPFLPGDSLLFAAGMLAAAFPDQLNIYIVLGLLWVAAIAGDTVNYTIGKTLGAKLVTAKIFGKRIIKDSAIQKTEDFFTKYGSKTIVIARFVPIVRTLAPFVAGISKMHYGTFIKYNFIGGIIWVFGITLAGYFLGTIPFIKNNFEIVVMAIIVFSLVPIVVEFVKEKMKK
ncbi:DedA family protein [Empedobacter falsenii]|uniref:DedA family protein n=1 Tax=Empedobacter TaxID=59734 RepID=UPI00244A1165|nr:MULTISPECIES: DedA family protein [Empedobacter]MDH1883479.1 DedA family protein [Empedobacter sp. GD03797]MDM1040430.1 DedA family protein [Empedobacter brevis]MDM1135444.1 DedA family protein [Empedobacter sp. R750]